MTIKAILSALSLTMALGSHAATLPPLPPPPPSEADVGDADSFGHDTVYLGSASLSYLYLAFDCANIPGGFVMRAEDRCAVLSPQPATTHFIQGDLKTIRLPANASRSLLCLSITPFLFGYFENRTGSVQSSFLLVTADVVIQNEVLNDPTLINPLTQQPYGGQLTRHASLAYEEGSYAPGEDRTVFVNNGTNCGEGLISKSFLRSRGLSEAQATAFFTKPTKLIFGISGFVQSLDHAQFFYYARIYGDR